MSESTQLAPFVYPQLISSEQQPFQQSNQSSAFANQQQLMSKMNELHVISQEQQPQRVIVANQHQLKQEETQSQLFNGVQLPTPSLQLTPAVSDSSAMSHLRQRRMRHKSSGDAVLNALSNSKTAATAKSPTEQSSLGLSASMSSSTPSFSDSSVNQQQSFDVLGFVKGLSL